MVLMFFTTVWMVDRECVMKVSRSEDVHFSNGVEDRASNEANKHMSEVLIINWSVWKV